MTTPLEESSRSRRLAAVWFADIVEFTRLTAENHSLALRLVETLQAAATAAVESHEGKIVKFIGDGVMAEFASAEGAAVGGMQLLLRFGQLTEGWPKGPHQLRLGMHLGDVTVAADGDIYGDGVNRAARLEGLAEPGRLLISEDVYRQLRNRPDLILTELGTRVIKGYDDPLQVYNVEPTEELTRRLLRKAAISEAPAQATGRARSVRPIAVGLTVGVLSFVALAVWTASGSPGSDPLTLGPGAVVNVLLNQGRDGADATTAGSTPTVDPEAQELLLKGRRELERGTARGAATAAGILTRAIELAPDYAQAHLALAEARFELNTGHRVGTRLRSGASRARGGTIRARAAGKMGARPLNEMLPLVRGHLDAAGALRP